MLLWERWGRKIGEEPFLKKRFFPEPPSPKKFKY
jgi:hypothetical protein